MRITLLLIIAMLLIGCSQTPDSSVRTKTVVDDNYIATVEQAAQQSAVDVIWVNPPTRQIKEDN
ncbi:MAG: hypothetical protein GYB30_06945 [Gammaproteobacteria bacterium]|jgi:PBP1b-binding outer membrane lipoprotein LpoB|nr:hypothetical protein [Gammaproteobacteria bacterium]